MGKNSATEGDGTTAKTLTVEYPQLTMHAVCRDTEAFSRPCIYCQLDAPVQGMEQPQSESNNDSTSTAEAESDDDDGGEEDAAMDELRLSPDDDNACK